MISKQNTSMAEYTSFRCGGNARQLIIPENERELLDVLGSLNESGEEYIILGNGSNVLFKDSGYDGVVLKIGSAFDSVEIKDNIVQAGSGALLSVISKAAAAEGLSGFEFASGIPGSLGGGVFMNAGAYDGEMKNVLSRVRSVNRKGEVIVRGVNELELSYRHSIFMDNNEIILSAEIELENGDPEQINAKIADFTQRRITRQPLQYPSAGSFFKRPEGYYAGKLIQDAGLKGVCIGGAMVSPLHAGFIVNTGSATATDIIDLMKVIQETVMEKFSVMLEPEVRIIG